MIELSGGKCACASCVCMCMLCLDAQRWVGNHAMHEACTTLFQPTVYNCIPLVVLCMSMVCCYVFFVFGLSSLDKCSCTYVHTCVVCLQCMCSCCCVHGSSVGSCIVVNVR